MSLGGGLFSVCLSSGPISCFHMPAGTHFGRRWDATEVKSEDGLGLNTGESPAHGWSQKPQA